MNLNDNYDKISLIQFWKQDIPVNTKHDNIMGVGCIEDLPQVKPANISHLNWNLVILLVILILKINKYSE